MNESARSNVESRATVFEGTFNSDIALLVGGKEHNIPESTMGDMNSIPDNQK